MSISKPFVIKNGLEVNTDLIVADINTGRVGIATTIPLHTLHIKGGIGVTDLYVSGISTFGSDVDISNDLNVSGVSTFASDLDINASVDISDNLVVSGITTLASSGGITTTGGDLYVGGNLYVLDDIFYDEISGRNINISGISTLGTVQISSGIVTASSGIVTYYGDGQYLQNILSGVGVATAGGIVGTGATILDFRGAGISTVTVTSGIATINIVGGGGGGSVSISSVAPSSPTGGDLWYSIDYGRTFVYYDEVALGIGSTAVWVDAAPFNIGVVDINDLTVGSLTVTNDASITGLAVTNLSVTNINASGIITATSFDGSGSGLTGVSTNFVSAIGIQSTGTVIGAGITQLNFIGAGNTFAVNGTTVDISISGGGGGSGLFNTGITSAVGYLVTGSMATAYTATDAAVIHSIHITNIDGTNSADISGQLYGEYSIAYTVPVPAGSSVELLKQPKVLNTGDTIELQASATNDLHATISIEPQEGSTDFIGVGTDITSAATYIDLWTATADAVLQGILLSNDDGGADVKANVVWTDGSNNIQGYFAFEMTIPADATVEVLEQPKFLPSGYKVRVQGNQANRLEAILSAKTAA